MNILDMPSPGQYTQAHKLRTEMSHAINYCQIAFNRKPSEVPKTATDLIKFLEFCLEEVKKCSPPVKIKKDK